MNIYQRLKQLCRSTLIFHFWVTYVGVLVLPIVILTIGIYAELRVVNREIQDSNKNKLQHSIELVDYELDSVEATAKQISTEPNIKAAAAIKESSGTNMLTFKKSIDVEKNILQYHKSKSIDDIYIYYNKLQYVIFEQTLYPEKFFSIYLDKWKTDLEEWKQKIVSEDRIVSQYMSTYSGYLHYMMPLNIWDGKNDGVVVFVLNKDDLEDYFSFAEEYGDYAVYILDANNQILVKNDNDTERVLDLSKTAIEDIFPDVDENQMIASYSSERGWKYCILLPADAIAHRLRVLKLVAVWGLILTIGMGLLVTFLMALRESKPLNQMFNLLGRNQSAEKNPKKLLENVSSVVKSNEELQKEHEENLPLLQKAFFHDLITLDITNSKEMAYLAENAGISVSQKQLYVASVRFFTNNDFYDIDYQTLEEVKVIMQATQKYLQDRVTDHVWFYQRNYLSLFVIVENVTLQEMSALLESAYQWILTQFAAESDWGISSECQNLMNIWKNCEEAEIARNHCEYNKHMQIYDPTFADGKLFYFPDVAQEKVLNGLKSGDLDAVDNMFAILEQENLINRKLTRNSFIKFNAVVTDLLTQLETTKNENVEYIMRLNEIVVNDQHITSKDYFSFLKDILHEICGRIKKVKGIQQNQLIEKMQQFINDNYADSSLGLTRVSTAFHISEGYISTLFKERTNINFADYVEKVRLGKACELLKDNNLTIETIAMEVGYNSVHSFRRAFKRVYHINPKEYR